jgi:hypothetical protein
MVPRISCVRGEMVYTAAAAAAAATTMHAAMNFTHLVAGHHHAHTEALVPRQQLPRRLCQILVHPNNVNDKLNDQPDDAVLMTRCHAPLTL